MRRYQLTPALLQEHFDLLASRRLCQLTVSEILGQDGDEAQVLLTFDDAFSDFHEIVLSLLVRYKLKASLFVPTGFIGQDARWLHREGVLDKKIVGWGQLKEVRDSGVVEIGAHRHWHRALDQVSSAALKTEVELPQKILQQELQIEVPTFAYPFGSYDRRVVSVTSRSYRGAFAVDGRHVLGADSRYSVPRIAVTSGLSAGALDAIISRRTAPTALRHLSRFKHIAKRGRRSASTLTARHYAISPYGRRCGSD